jgi:hypothetical protein
MFDHGPTLTGGPPAAYPPVLRRAPLGQSGRLGGKVRASADAGGRAYMCARCVRAHVYISTYKRAGVPWYVYARWCVLIREAPLAWAARTRAPAGGFRRPWTGVPVCTR